MQAAHRATAFHAFNLVFHLKGAWFMDEKSRETRSATLRYALRCLANKRRDFAEH